MAQARYLTEVDVARLVTVTDAIVVLEEAFALWRDPGTTNLPRQRAMLAAGRFNLMGAACEKKSIFGLKAYFAGKGGACYHVLLYAADGGGLLAMMEADLLGALRTGAASGLATKLMANPDARSLAVIGAGKQARTQAAAICAVRKIDRIRVYSPTREHRTAFAFVLADELGIETEPVDSGEACVDGADVVVTVTKSADPVCRAEWLKPGAHVNAAGANAADRRELDPEIVIRAALRVTDDRAQAQVEAAEFRDLVSAGRLAWSDIHELGDLLTGRVRGRSAASDITVYKSLGIALEDIAFAELIYRRALAAKVGRPL
ncbi:MAG: ornithine cyclodeaminase family protein [Xanthobacteraceae bacterium]|jgi:alanine dehydrogenase